MAIQTPPRRLKFRRRSERDAGPDNRLTFMDQAGIQLLRATGRGQLMQAVWIYEHPVDFEALKRFHRNFGYGLFGRRIERSPLSFGRYRWVSSFGPPAEIEFVETPRPRSEVSDWADEQAQVPVDPEWGPGWHLGVLPMNDGSTAISLAGSHHLVDGGGALLTIVEGVLGSRRDLRYPPPRSRTRFRGAVIDLRDTVMAAPEAARTVVTLGKLGLRQRRDRTTPTAPKPAVISPAPGDETIVVVPAISVFVDLADWDARAKSLNGTSYSLVAGYTAKLAERMGRHGADGVSLIIALNDRMSLDDTRATAMLFAPVNIDPKPLTTDLTDARNAIRQALKTARDVPDETLQLLPLVPLVPRRVLKRVVEQFLGTGAELPVSCSNLGDIPAAVGRPDGTEAEYAMLRGVDQNVRRDDLERAGGQLVAVAARVNGKMSIGLVAYQPGRENSKPHFRQLAAHTLADFELTGEIV